MDLVRVSGIDEPLCTAQQRSSFSFGYQKIYKCGTGYNHKLSFIEAYIRLVEYRMSNTIFVAVSHLR